MLVGLVFFFFFFLNIDFQLIRIMSPIFFNNDLSNSGHCIMGEKKKKKSLNAYFCSILSDVSADKLIVESIASYINITCFY